MLENFVRYLYKTLKMSAKNVFSGLGQYACFFAAIFIIQVFFATLTVILYNNDNTEWERVQEEYDYHVVVYGLNEDQMLIVDNYWRHFFGRDDVYNTISSVEHHDVYDDISTFDIYLKLKDYDKEVLNASYSRFSSHLHELAQGGALRYETTPLLNFDVNLLVNRLIYIVSIAALIALSVFLLVILYNIRINHYKFIYGIYMSFGADFKKLFETAFWEMFVVAAITFLPATGVSVLISWAILTAHGIAFSCPLWTLLLTVVYGLIVLLFSVWFPMKIMAIKPPMTLIVSQDNSNLVSSPRRSLNIFGSKFPLNYELYSTWRFRKYNLRLLVSAIIFTSLFMCGLYIAEITRVTLANDTPQYTVDLSSIDRKFDSSMRDELYTIPGVTLVSKSNTKDAIHIGSHISVPSEYTLPLSGLLVPDNTDGISVTNDIQYRTTDEDIVADLEKYEYDGDLSSPLHDDSMIVVADSIGNTRRFNYKVGDKIEIATVVKQNAPVDMNLSDAALLREQLEKFEFEYREFTIGAIIYDIPTLKMPVYVSEAAFEAITGEAVSYDTLEIYVDDSLSADETIALESTLRNWGLIYGGASVENTHALHMSRVNEDKQYDEIFTLVAALLLTISPMIWFFSQTLYYYKRENEITILQSMGALRGDIRRLYVLGGIFMGILSFVFCIVLGYSLSYLLFRFVNVIIPQWTLSYVRYKFYMPWYAILLSVIMSVACGFLSSFLPYRSFMRRKAETLTVEYGEVSE